MQQKFDYTDIRILEGLGIYGPRDTSDLARKLYLKRGTVWKRIQRLSSLFYLKFFANPYHTNLGLKKAVVFAWANPGQEDLLFDGLCANDFRNFISRCYGASEGCFAVYTIPKDHISEFRSFLKEIETLGLTRSTRVLYSTCFQNVNITSTWFNAESEHWVYPWEKWVEGLAHEDTSLPYTLIDPKDFPVLGDEVDLLIIKELEKDATVAFLDIAKKLNVSRQTVEYHYQNHILEKGLIESVQVMVAPFDRRDTSYPLVFNFRFKNEESMAKFALSLLDKPFVHIVGKILEQKALVAYLHFLSRADFRGFIHALSQAVKRGFLQDYDYVFIDLDRRVRETIRHEFFKDGSWIYNHDEHMRKLEDLMRRQHL